MTVSEKHIKTAWNALFGPHIVKTPQRKLLALQCAAALAAAEREGMKRAATFAAIHSQYPIENDYDRGYAQSAKDAAARIRREANTHSPDPSHQVNSPASTSSPEPGTPFSSQVFSMSSPANTAGSDGSLCPATHHASPCNPRKRPSRHDGDRDNRDREPSGRQFAGRLEAGPQCAGRPVETTGSRLILLTINCKSVKDVIVGGRDASII